MLSEYKKRKVRKYWREIRELHANQMKREDALQEPSPARMYLEARLMAIHTTVSLIDPKFAFTLRWS